MTTQAKGPFEVKMTPQPFDESITDSSMARFLLDKQFHGDLEATSKGVMLSSGNPSGSAGYVALEKVTGALHGHNGTFVLQHTGTMNRGTPTLSITVVPDSGTDRLSGLAGNMSIDRADGKHTYIFEYTLAQSE